MQLLGGDACTTYFGPPDCKVDLFDLVLLGSNYGSSPPTDVRADINGNGAVDIYDLVMVGLNLGKQCPGPWSAPSASSLRALHQLTCAWHRPMGSTRWITCSLLQSPRRMSDLYGADVNLHFAPGVLEVLDQDPFKEGVQILSGPLLYPDNPTQVGMNQADNETAPCTMR